MKKLFAVLLCAAMLLGTASGCGSARADDTGSGASVAESIAPPENGWTKEQLLDTAYLCGRKISSPVTVASLGKDFKLDKKSISVNSDEYYATAHLLYKGRLLGGVRIENVSKLGDVTDSTPIAILMINSREGEVKSVEPVSVNGVRIGDTLSVVETALGDKYEKNGAVYTFKGNDTDGFICKFLISGGTISVVILDFK